MNIIEPDQREKNISIEYVLNNGLSKPKSLLHYLREIYCTLGSRYVFMNTAWAIIISAIAATAFILFYPLSHEENIYSTLFACAPVFFICVVMFTESIERTGEMYELKMTFKYTIQQVTAFRILCFSFLGTISCMIISFFFSRLPVSFDFVKAFSVSLCSLFICALLTIFIMEHFNRTGVYFSAMFAWIIISLLPSWIFGQTWELFLSDIPVAITTLIAIVIFYLFLLEIKKIMICKREVITC